MPKVIAENDKNSVALFAEALLDFQRALQRISVMPPLISTAGIKLNRSEGNVSGKEEQAY